MKLKKILNESFSRFIKDKSELELMINYVNSKYTEEHRHYHNNKHIEDLYNKMTSIKTAFTYYEDVLISLIFHDIIYDEKGNNEARSAEICADFLSKYKFIPLRINKINKMILATSSHQRTNDNDTNLFLDLDMSILGSDTYETYSNDIYLEYYTMYNKLENFNEEEFKKNYIQNRIKFLTKLNNRDYIYLTKQFKHLEQKAKINIINEIEKLNNEII